MKKLLAVAASTLLLTATAAAQTNTPEAVSPWTGIVLWTTNENRETTDVSLEYAYVGYDQAVDAEGNLDPAFIESLLDDLASRGHQAILRFYYVYPAQESTVPNFLRNRDDYHGVTADSEGNPTGFADWSNAALQDFTIDFHRRFAERYDQDPRLAYLQVGFGLWGEYHIYDGPRELGQQFPTKAYQAKFLKALDGFYEHTPWMISIDAADDTYSPIVAEPGLLHILFGVFDDSFLHGDHGGQNESNWNKLDRGRWRVAPAGGELGYYTAHDQQEALAPNGPHGEPFADAAARFHLTFMIGNDQWRYREPEVIRAASLAIGYRFKLDNRDEADGSTTVFIKNIGIAPAYHDCFAAVGGVRSDRSLKGLLPGKSLERRIEATGGSVSIDSDRLVPGQVIPLDG